MNVHHIDIAKNGGEGEIRTHGPSRGNGFRDRRIRPLCHLSLQQSYYLKYFPEKEEVLCRFHNIKFQKIGPPLPKPLIIHIFPAQWNQIRIVHEPGDVRHLQQDGYPAQ